jgi:uncharacterized protein YegL
MAKNDFMAEEAANFEQKCLCVLVLDVSGSMSGKPVQELNEGLANFYDEITNDESTSQKLEVSVITFNHIVKTVVEPSLVENFTMPKLSVEGSTAMVNAVNEAIDKVEARKAWYKQTNQNYYRPWIILITDGDPDDDQDVNALSSRVKNDMANKKYVFLPIGVEGANMGILDKIAGMANDRKMGPLKLKGTNFKSFFQWLSASMGAVVNTEEGQTVNLGGSDTTWMDSFVI